LDDALREHGSTVKRVVIGGGDGTLNRALSVLHQAGLPVGILPMGTANDFARSLQLPLDPLEAVDVIVAGHTRLVELGKVNGHWFLNAVGIGLGPTLTKKLDHERKQRLGILAYFSSLIEVIGQNRRHRADIHVDGQRHHIRFMQITIANGIHYGGGMTIADDAELNDGFLNVLCLEPQSPVELLGKFVKLRFGTRDKQPKVLTYKGRKVEVVTNRVADVTADGELLTKTPVVCECVPDALEVFAPQTSTRAPKASS